MNSAATAAAPAVLAVEATDISRGSRAEDGDLKMFPWEAESRCYVGRVKLTSFGNELSLAHLSFRIKLTYVYSISGTTLAYVYMSTGLISCPSPCVLISIYSSAC